MRAVVIYAALLGVTMMASYVTWTADEDTRTEDARAVAVYRANPGEVEKITYDSADLKVTVERKKDAKGEFPWITVDETKRTTVVPPHDDHPGDDHEEGDTDAPAGPDGPKAPEPVETVEQVHHEFRGNDNAEGLLTAFEPLMALRELDPATAKPGVFGFDEPTATLTVSRKAGDIELVIGGETYGSRDRYAKTGDRLLLLPSTSIKPLQFASSRTVERRLQPWGEADVDKLTLTTDQGTLELTQQNKADRKAAFWSRNGTDPDEIAATWVEKAFRGRADQHGKEADLAGLTPALTMVFTKGSETHQIELFTGGENTWVRSDFLRGVAQVKESDAVELLADAQELFQE